MSNDRVLEVSLNAGAITVTGESNFKKGEFAVRWVKQGTGDWSLYNIAFGPPLGRIPPTFPISGIFVTPGTIALKNDNKGTLDGQSTILPYTLYVLADGQIITAGFSDQIGEKVTGTKGEEPLQLENEPD